MKMLMLAGCAAFSAAVAFGEPFGNPILPGWYADPQIRQFGDTFWIFPTYSHDFGEQTFFDAFSSKDLKTWTRHEKVLSSQRPLATGAGHHSVLNLRGTDDWYICYHRRPIPNESMHHRVTCIDRLYFEENGDIRPVRMTAKEPVDYVNPLIR